MKRQKMHTTAVITLALAALAIVQPTPTHAQKGPGEGIKVHGRWTIDVRNPDGTLASHNEFNNALFHEGMKALAGLLGRFYGRAGTWSIVLTRAGSLNSPPGPCVTSSGQGTSCFLAEHQGSGDPAIGELGLSLPVGSTGPAGTFTLSGATLATGEGPIEYVRTQLGLCVGESCGSSTFVTFTEHRLATPITVAPNQIIQVTVVFSFS